MHSNNPSKVSQTLTTISTTPDSANNSGGHYSLYSAVALMTAPQLAAAVVLLHRTPRPKHRQDAPYPCVPTILASSTLEQKETVRW